MRTTILSLALLSVAQAEETAGREWSGGLPFSEWTCLTGDWAGARTDLADRGFACDGSLVNEVSRVLRAGTDEDERNGQRSQVNLGLQIDFEKLVGLPKAEFRAAYQYAGGDAAGIAVGDAQGWSNLSVDDDVHQLNEFWYQQRFGAVPGDPEGDLLRLKLGKIDANSEFDTVPALAQFLNSSAGFSPTIFTMPTYPNPAVGINLFVQPVAGITVGLGYYDATATTQGAKTGELGGSNFFSEGLTDDKLLLAQVEGQWTGGIGQVGGWLLRGDLTGFDGQESDSTTGWYALAQQAVWNEGEARSITLVAQLAGADDNLCDFALHAAAGVWGQGLIPARPADGLGLYVTDVTFTDAVDGLGERLVPATRETAVEAVYALQATGWWLLRADLQYIRNPGGSEEYSSAMVTALRSDIAF